MFAEEVLEKAKNKHIKHIFCRACINFLFDTHCDLFWSHHESGDRKCKRKNSCMSVAAYKNLFHRSTWCQTLNYSYSSIHMKIDKR